MSQLYLTAANAACRVRALAMGPGIAHGSARKAPRGSRLSRVAQSPSPVFLASAAAKAALDMGISLARPPLDSF